MRNCPSCNRNIEGEYLNVLAVDVDRFNYCCSECLAQHLRVPRHIQWKLTDEDKEEIRKIVYEELELLIDNTTKEDSDNLSNQH